LYTTLIVIHLLVCFFLIFIVLIQSSKGAELGAAFGGSNQTLFGSRGASTFLNKLTTGVAVAFMLTSLFLAVLASQRGSIMPETTPARELPAQPFTETAPIPAEEQPAETGQAPVQETPVQPSQPAD
jgi:preprotein translocase subunit SecG